MKQSKALQILKSGRNVFLTGSAGAGKTYVLNSYIRFLKSKSISVAVTASTGIAATHMNGMTIHSWSGMGVKDSIGIVDLNRMSERRYMKTRMKKVQVLIIDEISMLHKKQLEVVDFILQFFKGNNKAFGGIQVVLSGDFFQLPPVTKNDEKNRDKFCFMANSWVDANFTICYLTEQYRQEDNELNEILNDIRGGSPSTETEMKLQEAQYNRLSNVPVKLYTHNFNVDEENKKELMQIGDYAESYKAIVKGNESVRESLKKSILCPENLELKIGAQVMFVKNNQEQGYMNGSLGRITGYDAESGYPEVELLDGSTVVAEPQIWKVENEQGKTVASFEQVPLRLAWAITVHKSQGMTLELAEIDLTNTFEKGPGYVALSRLKDINGMKLLGFNETALEVDNLALKADKRFQELSEHADNSLKEEQLVSECEAFMSFLGARDKKESTLNTYEQTLQLLKKSYSIKSIAKERELTEGTIIKHILKLKKENSELDVSHLKPERSILLLVESALHDIRSGDDYDGGGIKHSILYNKLNGAVSYEDIKLCQLFLSYE